MATFGAVLVGINDYPNGNQLRGCTVDVSIFRDILVQRHKIPTSSIRMVLNERATKDEILMRLNWLVDSGVDQGIFYYSGHGAQIPVQDYTNPNQEPNGMDSLICPVDFDWNGTYIMDTQIGEILKKMRPNQHMTMVFDSCHSGTIDRGEFFGYKSNMVQVFENKIKAIPTPLDLLSRMPGTALTGASLDMAFTTGGTFGKVPQQTIITNPIGGTYSQQNVSILTGCKDEQTSADAWVGNRFQGALSFFMQGLILEQATIDLKTLRDLCEAKLKKAGYTQTPQIICSKENLGKSFIQVSNYGL